MSKSLVIVESPAKAKTIGGFLGDDYTVVASVGHIRDLATKATLPGELKEKWWAFLGVDVESSFKAYYVVSDGAASVVRNLKKELKQASELYLATDEDREGEAIAWHLLEELQPKTNLPVKRMVFHEITQKAIDEALSNTRSIDNNLVEAQEARRILDRLYGFEVSNKLVTIGGPGTSAGPVQSPTTRLVVERELERAAFIDAGYWSLGVPLTSSVNETFSSRLVSLDGLRIALTKDFGEDGKLKSTKVVALTETDAVRISENIEGVPFTVDSVDHDAYRRRPQAPFTTSTFQQAASSKLGLNSKIAMGAAQSLYQQGYITYMRTDSTTLSDSAMRAARSVATEKYGSDHLPASPRQYQSKVQNAQEAHEAIRPAGDTFKEPRQVRIETNESLARVYELIWQRTIASQMTDTTGETVRMRLSGSVEVPDDQTSKNLLLGVSGTVISHEGFRRVYSDDAEGNSAEDSETVTAEIALPDLKVGDTAIPSRGVPQGRSTKPPARYTDASLVKKMEELGIGRPSTYASTIERILNNGYAFRKGRALCATAKAIMVVNVLGHKLPKLVDFEERKKMEEDLDSISNGRLDRSTFLSNLYWGLGGLNRTELTDGKDYEFLDNSAKCGCNAINCRTRVIAGDPGLHFKAVNNFVDVQWSEKSHYLGRIPEDLVGVEGLEAIDPSLVGEVRLGYLRSPYLRVGDEGATTNIQPDQPIDELDIRSAWEYLNKPDARLLGEVPNQILAHATPSSFPQPWPEEDYIWPNPGDVGKPVYVRPGTFGPYVSLGEFAKFPKLSTKEGRLIKLPHHRKPCKVAMAYMRMLIDSESNEAILEVINAPKRGVGKASLDKLVANAEENSESLLQAFKKASDLGIKGNALAGINEFLDVIAYLDGLKSERPDELVRNILQKSGYWAEIETGASPEANIEILENFVQVIAEFDSAEAVVDEFSALQALKDLPKPKTSSLFKFMTVEDVTLEEALALLSLPREIIHPFCGNPIIISNGPFGPYLKHTCDDGPNLNDGPDDGPDELISAEDLKIFGKSETRSLDNEDQLLSLTLEEAVKKLKEPKKFGRMAKAPLQEFGKDPDSGNMVSLKDGKFGPYVTDGEYMASLALGDIPEDLTFDRALELLAEKKLKGPPKKKAYAKKRAPKFNKTKK
jgi:DNA topoisomerase I